MLGPPYTQRIRCLPVGVGKFTLWFGRLIVEDEQSDPHLFHGLIYAPWARDYC